MQLNPIYNNVLLDIYDFFELNITKNFKDRKIILDPGIGFGKTLKHNLTLISKISLFHSLGLPILPVHQGKDLLAKYLIISIQMIVQEEPLLQFFF